MFSDRLNLLGRVVWMEKENLFSMEQEKSIILRIFVQSTLESVSYERLFYCCNAIFFTIWKYTGKAGCL